MYMFPEMVNMGLHEGQEFPSDDHRVVATTLCIGVPGLDNKDDLTTIVQSVLKVPQDRIRTVTIDQLKMEYDMHTTIY